VVGGGVRIPCIQACLKSVLGRDLSFTCDGDESVARGCVLQVPRALLCQKQRRRMAVVFARV
jgi:molecular chaperone DnaK (HSP70)